MKPGGRDRDGTTEAIRDAAVAELLAVGQADFAMESVAKRAFFSIGTVYNRWPDRDALLADVAAERVIPAITAGIGACSTGAEVIDWILGDGQPTAVLAGEILLAGRSSATVLPSSINVWEALRAALGMHLPDSIAWYVSTYAIGNALLGAIGARGPNPARGRTTWLDDACRALPGGPASARTRVPDAVEVPVVPAPRGEDDVSLALIGAAQALLAQHGASGTSTRDIAASAGVTTGALYRRYDGKSGLLADVLLAQLQPDRYTWTWDLVRALAGDDPLGDASAVLARRMIEVSSDEKAQAVLLQLGIAARNDPALQIQISDRIMAAHRARVDMVQHFADAGLLRTDVDPVVFAWGFQAIPVGVRATQAVGIVLDPAVVSAAMEALLRTAAAMSTPEK